MSTAQNTLNHVQLRESGASDGLVTVTRIAGDADDTTKTLHANLITAAGDLSTLCRWVSEGRPRGYPESQGGGVVYRRKATGWSYGPFDPATLNAAIAWEQGTVSE